MLLNSEKEKLLKEVYDFFGFGVERKLSAEEQDKIRSLLWARAKQMKEKRLADLKGPKKLADAMACGLDELQRAAESPIEERLLMALNSKSMTIGRARGQHRVGPYRIDIAFPEVHLAVECDGRSFHSEPAQIARDQQRTHYLDKLGWTVLRFTGTQIKRDLYGCVDRVMLVYEKLAAESDKRESWE